MQRTWSSIFACKRNECSFDSYSLLTNPQSTFGDLLLPTTLPADIIAICIQAAAKIYSTLVGGQYEWTPSRKSFVTLLTDKTIRFLEPLSISPSLEVQERAVEFLELFHLAVEAIDAQPTATNDGEYENPLLLTQVIPSMFDSQELNPVAARIQRRVPLPPGLDLEETINPVLQSVLETVDPIGAEEDDNFNKYYFTKPSVAEALPTLKSIEFTTVRMDAGQRSYQGFAEEHLDEDIIARRRSERYERNLHDPFYIFTPGDSEDATEADIESIPILKLELSHANLPLRPVAIAIPARQREHVEIAADEGLGMDDEGEIEDVMERSHKRRGNKGLLRVDTSGLVGYSLEDDQREQQHAEEVKLAREEVHRFRREMEVAATKAKIGKGLDKTKAKSQRKKAKGGNKDVKRARRNKARALEGDEGTQVGNQFDRVGAGLL